MPFGLTNGPATYQRVMDKILQGEQRKFVLSFLDDTIVLKETLEKHIEHFKIVFSKIKACGIILNLKKCKMFYKEITILGQHMSNGKVEPDPEKIQNTQKFKAK